MNRYICLNATSAAAGGSGRDDVMFVGWLVVGFTGKVYVLSLRISMGLGYMYVCVYLLRSSYVWWLIV